MTAMLTLRLQQALNVDGTIGLFRLLKDWPASELELLGVDIEVLSEGEKAVIAERWRLEAFKPEHFGGGGHGLTLEETLDAARLQVLTALGKISAVAEYYLDRKKNA